MASRLLAVRRARKRRFQFCVWDYWPVRWLAGWLDYLRTL